MQQKDKLINEQKVIIQELRTELDSIFSEQDNHSTMISQIKDKIMDNKSQIERVTHERERSKERMNSRERYAPIRE